MSFLEAFAAGKASGGYLIGDPKQEEVRLPSFSDLPIQLMMVDVDVIRRFARTSSEEDAMLRLNSELEEQVCFFCHHCGIAQFNFVCIIVHLETLLDSIFYVLSPL